MIVFVHYSNFGILAITHDLLTQYTVDITVGSSILCVRQMRKMCSGKIWSKCNVIFPLKTIEMLYIHFDDDGNKQ